MRKPDRYWLPGMAFTLGLYLLVAMAVAEDFGAAADWAVRLSFAMPILAFMAGVWLIIFGFSEVLRFARGHRLHDAHK